MQKFDLVHKNMFARTLELRIFNPIGILVYSYVVDISDIHASDGVFAVERIGSQLFSWCGPYTCPATTAIRYGTLTHQAVVCIDNTCTYI